MGIIKVLDKDTIDKIAAGEVVVNAASAIKELTENSIDAGSTEITVETSGGGKTLIRVTDNGCGIHRDDIKAAFMRSATSKISNSLDAVETLGFRGEALASITAVSKINLITRTQDDELAAKAAVTGGEIVSETQTVHQKGTVIEIRDLFYNFPARQKHLKKDSAETAEIIETVSMLALSNTGISFRLICDSKEIFLTDGKGDFRKAAGVVLGRRFAEGMLETDIDEDPLFVRGIISSPSHITASPQRIIILNGRYIKSSEINRAADAAYEEICGKRGASFLLYITLPYSYVDVNVHPAKLQIRLMNESLILMLIKQGIKKTLSRTFVLMEDKILPESSFSDPKPADRMVFSEVNEYIYHKNKTEADEFAGAVQSELPDAAEDENPGVQVFSEPPEPAPDTKNEAAFRVDKSVIGMIAAMKYIGNAFGLYAMLEAENEVFVIDTHAAHERVLYEKYLNEYRQRGIAKQALLVPIIKQLSPLNLRTVLENTDLLDSLGFEADDIGDNSAAFRSVPVLLASENISSAVDSVVQELLETRSIGGISERSEILIKRACHNAVRGSEDISEPEIRHLISELKETEMPFTCPHGRPIIAKISERNFMKAFERI